MSILSLLGTRRPKSRLQLKLERKNELEMSWPLTRVNMQRLVWHLEICEEFLEIPHSHWSPRVRTRDLAVCHGEAPRGVSALINVRQIKAHFSH
jgi:hypothetical protein